MNTWWIARLAMALLVPAVVQTTAAQAGSYFICKDANHRTIMSDTPPPECANQEIREHGRGGTLRRVIEPPLTAEQRVQRVALANIKAEEESARLNAKRRDSMLLQIYDSEEDIERSRERTLGDSLGVLVADTERIEQLKKEYSVVQNQVNDFLKKNPGKAVPFVLERNAENLLQRIQQQNLLLSRRQEEVARINARFDEDKKRWLEIKKGENKKH